MDDFREGANYVLNHIERRLYYIPDKWKEKGDAGAIFAIINNVVNDLRKDLDIEKEGHSEQITNGEGV